MTWKVPLTDISFGAEELEAAHRVLESGWISMGPETERFESEFSEYLGVKHAVAVSSGTAALHLALLALGIGAGDEVIVPSFTFVATVNAILYVGATPVFADITGLDDWNISPDDIERKITPRTKAVIVVHYAGFPCQMDGIAAIAGHHGLKVVEDAAHAPGATFQDRKLGTWGDVGCFSFYSNKNMTTGEGGMAVTSHSDVAGLLRSLRCHGMTSPTWDRHRGHNFSYDVVSTGFNYRIDEIRAAIGRAQLRKLDKNNAARRHLTKIMRELVADTSEIEVPFSKHDIEASSCHIFPVFLRATEQRSCFMNSLKTAGIQTSIHYPPVHRFSAYRHAPWKGLSLTEVVSSREVTLPLFPTMTEKHIMTVFEAIRSYEGSSSR